MRNMERVGLEQVIALIERQCRELGSANAFARRHQISPAYLSDILSRKRLPGQKALKAMGLRKITLYERVNS